MEFTGHATAPDAGDGGRGAYHRALERVRAAARELHEASIALANAAAPFSGVEDATGDAAAADIGRQLRGAARSSAGMRAVMIAAVKG